MVSLVATIIMRNCKEEKVALVGNPLAKIGIIKQALQIGTIVIVPKVVQIGVAKITVKK